MKHSYVVGDGRRGGLSRRTMLRVGGVLGAVPGAVTACGPLGSGQPSGVQDAGPKLKTGITLRLAHLTAGIDQDILRQQQLAAFEQRYQGIKTEFVSVSGAYNDKILAMMAANDVPDGSMRRVCQAGRNQLSRMAAML